MHTFLHAVKQFGRDEDGITAIEYGLIAAVMAVAITAAFDTLKTGLATLMTGVVAKFSLA